VATLLGWGAVTIEITEHELRAGSQRLALCEIAEVTALDAAQTGALRGARGDPAAYLLVRPYLPMSVYVEIAGRPPERPYWLLATRKPGELAAAIERARPARLPAGHGDDSAVRPTGHADGDPAARAAPDAVG
jgi:hypothetical protein